MENVVMMKYKSIVTSFAASMISIFLLTNLLFVMTWTGVNAAPLIEGSYPIMEFLIPISLFAVGSLMITLFIIHLNTESKYREFQNRLPDLKRDKGRFYNKDILLEPGL